MITLSNGHKMEYVIASGALGFDGRGWPWERPLAWAGLIKPKLFDTVFIKSLTLKPRRGNLSWWHPWTCFRFIGLHSAVNKIGLTNKGSEWWFTQVAPKMHRRGIRLGGSIYGKQDELVIMAYEFNSYNIVALEVNVSCPNAVDRIQETELVVASVRDVCRVSRHPVIVKVSVAQDYVSIVRALAGMVEAVDLNSVPWEIVFPDKRSPLWRLQRQIGGGGGGVSGRLAQRYNWEALRRLAQEVPEMPVIGPDVMSRNDMWRVRELGARAVSFGNIHLLTPWHPTSYVKKEKKQQAILTR